MKVQVSVPCDRTKPQDYSILRIREAVSKFAVVLYLMKRRREKEKRERAVFFFHQPCVMTISTKSTLSIEENSNCSSAVFLHRDP